MAKRKRSKSDFLKSLLLQPSQKKRMTMRKAIEVIMEEYVDGEIKKEDLFPEIESLLSIERLNVSSSISHSELRLFIQNHLRELREEGRLMTSGPQQQPGTLKLVDKLEVKTLEELILDTLKSIPGKDFAASEIRREISSLLSTGEFFCLEINGSSEITGQILGRKLRKLCRNNKSVFQRHVSNRIVYYYSAEEQEQEQDEEEEEEEEEGEELLDLNKRKDFSSIIYKILSEWDGLPKISSEIKSQIERYVRKGLLKGDTKKFFGKLPGGSFGKYIRDFYEEGGLDDRIGSSTTQNGGYFIKLQERSERRRRKKKKKKKKKKKRTPKKKKKPDLEIPPPPRSSYSQHHPQSFLLPPIEEEEEEEPDNNLFRFGEVINPFRMDPIQYPNCKDRVPKYYLIEELDSQKFPKKQTGKPFVLDRAFEIKKIRTEVVSLFDRKREFFDDKILRIISFRNIQDNSRRRRRRTFDDNHTPTRITRMKNLRKMKIPNLLFLENIVLINKNNNNKPNELSHQYLFYEHYGVNGERYVANVRRRLVLKNLIVKLLKTLDGLMKKYKILVKVNLRDVFVKESQMDSRKSLAQTTATTNSHHMVGVKFLLFLDNFEYVANNSVVEKEVLDHNFGVFNELLEKLSEMYNSSEEEEEGESRYTLKEEKRKEFRTMSDMIAHVLYKLVCP